MVDPVIFTTITILGAILGFKVISTQNPVYSGLYLVLLFFLGSGIAFLLGLEFIGLLFILVYAGAIAVLVLFVVMMLDVKAIENSWPASQKQAFLFFCSILLFLFLYWREDLQYLLKLFMITLLGSSVFSNIDILKDHVSNFDQLIRILQPEKIKWLLNDRNRSVGNMPYLDDLLEFFRLSSLKNNIDSCYVTNKTWLVEFDSSCALNDPSYLLYSTYAILLIIAGVILLIAMVGAIALTLQKNCPESLHRQLGRESQNAVFFIKEKISLHRIVDKKSEALK